MAERMTSRKEADHMRDAIREVVDDLESDGLSRSQIGAAMAGIALGIIAAHDGPTRAEAILDRLRAQLGAAA